MDHRPFAAMSRWDVAVSAPHRCHQAAPRPRTRPAAAHPFGRQVEAVNGHLGCLAAAGDIRARPARRPRFGSIAVASLFAGLGHLTSVANTRPAAALSTTAMTRPGRWHLRSTRTHVTDNHVARDHAPGGGTIEHAQPERTGLLVSRLGLNKRRSRHRAQDRSPPAPEIVRSVKPSAAATTAGAADRVLRRAISTPTTTKPMPSNSSNGGTSALAR